MNRAIAVALAASIAASARADDLVSVGGPLVTDGTTPQSVVVQIPGLGVEDRVRVRARGARVLDTVRGPMQTLTVSLRPDAAVRPREIDLAVKVRGGLSLDGEARVPGVPAPNGTIAVIPEPATVAIGDGGALIKLSLAGSAHLPATHRRIAVRASQGQVGEPVALGEGQWGVPWSPPADLATPVPVVLTAVDLTAPETVVGRAVLPVTTAATLTVDAPVGSEATLVVGGRPHGPLVVPASGVAAFDVALRPGEHHATVRVRDMEGDEVERTIPTGISGDGVLAFAMPEGTKVPGGAVRRLWLAAVDASGRPDPDAQVRVDGAVRVEGRGDGWFVAHCPAPVTPGPWTVTATAGARTATVTLDVLPVPARVVLSAEPERLADAERVTVRAVARDVEGSPVRTDLALWLGGERLAVATGRDGEVTRTVPVAGPELVGAAVTPVVPTGLPPARIVAWSGRDAVVAGGASVAPIVVVVEDAFGVPVPDQRVILAVDAGGGFAAPSADTGPDGVAIVGFSPGLQPGLASLVVISGPLSTAVPVWQVVAEPGPPSPAVGSAQRIADEAAWRARVPVWTWRRDGPPIHRRGTERLPVPVPGRAPVDLDTDVVAPVDVAPPVPESDEPERLRPSQERAAREPIGGPAVRVHAALAHTGHVFRQTTGANPMTLASSASYVAWPGAAGVDVGVTAQVTDRVAVVADGRLGAYRLRVGGDASWDLLGSVAVGAALRHALGPAVVAGSAAIHATDTVAFVYTADRTDADPVAVPIVGARFGGRGELGVGAGTLGLSVAETFAPLPSVSAVDLDLAVPLRGHEGVYLFGGLGVTWRHVGYRREDERTRIADRQDRLTVGVEVRR